EPAKATQVEPAQVTKIPLAFLIWGGGIIILSGRLLLGSCLLSLLIRKARRVSDKELPGLLRVVDFLKLKRIPRVYASSRVRVPMCCGVLRPTILLPETLLQSDKAETLELV